MVEGSQLIPLLERRFYEEGVQMEAGEKEREEQHLSLILTVKVITDETFSRHKGFNLATFEESNFELPILRVFKQETYGVFKWRVARHFNHPESQVRLWVLKGRANGTVRPSTDIPEYNPSLSTLCRLHADCF